jgi:hypothetical protein
MSEMLKQVVESGGLLTLITVFVALPYLYLSLAAEVHKDCLEFRKLQASRIDQGMDTDEAKRVDLASRRIDSNSGVFDTDWWVLAALAVIMLGIFELQELAALSKYMPANCRNPVVEANCVMTSVTTTNVNLHCNRQVTSCDSVKNIFLLYTLMTALVIGFRLWWARLAIARDLQHVVSANRGVINAAVGLQR